MYDTSQLNEIVQELDTEIQALFQRYQDKFNAVIKKEVPKHHKMYIGNGTCFAHAKKGDTEKYHGEAFCELVSELCHYPENIFTLGFNYPKTAK